VTESQDELFPGAGKPDDDAPYGRKPDGTPYTRRPRPGTQRAAKLGLVGGGRKAAAPPRKRAAAPKKPEYAKGINGVFQLAAFPLTFVAPADAWAVTTHGPGIATALEELAHERPEIAAVLDKVLQAGPYGAIIAAVTPLVVQLLVNHGAVPESIGGALGAHPKDEILKHLAAEAEFIAAQGQAA